jgi:transmembrane sensor
LIEGKVEILNKEDWVMATLKPNESALFFPEGNELKIEKSNTLIYTSWQDGKIYFKNEPLLDIARRMERWYNVSIVIEDKALEQVPFTLTVLKNKPLNQILEALKLTYPISYSIEEKLGEKNIIKLKKEMPMGK